MPSTLAGFDVYRIWWLQAHQASHQPNLSHENKSNPIISGEMIGQRGPSITRGAQQAYGRRREEFLQSLAISSHRDCIEEIRRTKEGVLKMPDHTTGGIAADPGHPVSGPPGKTIGGEEEIGGESKNFTQGGYFLHA
ncbi:hypothetical protein AbraIFM66950_011404 [Aspergillus brasiliensis]|nr:hypothetical protein AbraIFM66950_011404 [Aspergillus brasiliensis]